MSDKMFTSCLTGRANNPGADAKPSGGMSWSYAQLGDGGRHGEHGVSYLPFASPVQEQVITMRTEVCY